MFVFGACPRLAWGMNEQGTEPTSPDEVDDSAGAIAATPQAPLIRWPIYHGWWIVLVGAGVLLLTTYANSNAANYIFEPEASPNQGSYWFALRLLASPLLLLLLLPLVGHFVDRRGPIVPITSVLLIAGTTYVVLAIIGPSWPSYILALLMGTAMSATARIAMMTTVANLFSRHLGKAFAVALAGVSLGAFMPTVFTQALFLTARSIGMDGYDTIQILFVAFLGGALLIVGLAFLYVMRRWPVWGRQTWQRGKTLDASARAPDEQSQSDTDVNAVPLGLREVLTGRSYYLYVAAIALYGSMIWPLSIVVSSGGGWLSFGAIFFSAIFTIPALLIIGALADLFSRKLVVMAILAMLLILTLPLASGLDSIEATVPFALGVIANGAAIPAVLALQREYFGRRHFGLLYGIQASISAFVSLVWTLFAAAIHDYFGSPTFERLSIILPLAIALVLILLMKRPQYGNATAESAPQVAV